MANRKPLVDEMFTEAGALCEGEVETVALGSALAARAEAGAVFSLEGPLGAGKTRLAQGIARGIGCDAEASSPTFAIVHEYTGGRLPVFHFDFYRMDDASELVTAGFDECLGAGVVVAEWGDKFPQVFPAGTIRMRIEIVSESARRIRGAVVR